MRALAFAAVVIAGSLSLLAACGQKGPLFLPDTQGASAKRAGHVPSAPEDRVPPSPAVQPMPSDEPIPATTGVVPPRK